MSLALVPPSPSDAPEPHTGPGAGQCLEGIREGDPAAARVLYTMYADQVRTYVRRHTGVREVESTVFSILLEAVRSTREEAIATPDELSQTVRELCQQGVFALRRPRSATAVPPRMTLDRHSELINGLFTVLDQREREILLRSSLLSERDDEISSDLKLPVLQIRRARAKARVLFRILCDSGDDYASAASA